MLVACGSGQSQDDSDQTPAVTPFAWQIPDIYPRPVIPAENPMTEEKFQLGRHLFYDKRLSGNGTQSCSSCHEQSKAFSDGKITPQGSTGQVLARNSQALTNVAYNATQTWANPSITTLERQILIPLFGEFPVEHGINDENRDEILQTLIEDPVYVRLFQKAYPELGSAISYNEVVNSLATFVRGLTSFDSPFDRFQQGDLSALSSNAIQGARLFFSERLECVHCHGGYNFSDSTIDETTQFPESPFHNTGLYNTDGSGAYPTGNQGLIEMTELATDMGKFKAPSLRNVALTAPYMHDGSAESLSEVIDFYAAGGRVIESGPNAGDGRLNPYKDGFVVGFRLEPLEKYNLIEFLKSLTDTTFVNSERFSDPWVEFENP